MLLIKGPNVMQGYMGQPDKTAEVIRDGWYVTGDIARIDDDGFIEITGRLSRFSKIGGEMVPHLRIEEALERVLGIGDSDELVVAVASMPDERKGERLVVVHRSLEQSPDEICQALRREGLPNLWIPDQDAFIEVDQIPVLGTGKLDLKGLSELVKERFACSVP
jgi:acyl-[acyl-carrier-protein]-phospholipid O-acyltransferase/long-chain-fatty-acid--[acyl-carrier-protein] ligase